MAGNYWIKFYVEVLDDPKMATLSDRLWRRFYELCLIAGRMYEDGNLPPDNQIAWALRIQNVADVTNDLLQLAQLGLITKTEDGWNIINFKKRQDPMTPAEKQSRYREEQKRDKYYQDTSNQSVTLSNASVTQITDNRADNRVDKDTEADVDSGDFSLLAEFESISKLQAPRDPADWNLSLQAMKNKGVTNTIMQQAVTELSEKNYKITGPKSIEQACSIILAKKKRESGPRRDEYAEFVMR